MSCDSATDRATVVVVGAGMAGSTAAARAAQLGRHVILIDGAGDPSAGGNTSLSGGGVHVTRQHLLADSDMLRERVLGQGWGHTRRTLVDAFVSTAPLAHQWIVGAGIRFEPKSAGKPTDLVPVDSYLAPRPDRSKLHDWPDRGPQQALRKLQAAVTALGGEVRASTPASSLSQRDDGRVAGVVLGDGTTIAADSVLLADGGFHANPELRRLFIGPAAERVFVRGSQGPRGVGLRMAQAVGAHLSNTDWVYGHVLHRDVVDNDQLWPWPTLDSLILDGGILVDDRGQRFVDEGRGGVYATNALGWSDDPAGAWVVISAEQWNGQWKHQDDRSPDPLSPNPELERRGAQLIRAAGVRTLAEQIGIDAAGFATTVSAYNAAASEGRTASLPVLRSGQARPLEGDLIALPAIAGVTFTMGGVAIDAQARVLDGAGEVIPGLLAAGASAAGPTAGYIGGLATALVFGYLAGRTLAEG